jgi:tetratricopeptide (TPR) repeat protein
MLDHYLHTAYSAAMQLHPVRRRITLAAPQPGAAPEPISGAAHALSWFGAERRVLMAAAGRALEAGFDTQAWQIPWALSRFLDTRGRWHDYVATEQIALAATERLGDRAAQASTSTRFGYASGRLGDYGSAHAHLERAVGIYTELGDHAGQAYAHNGLAIALSSQGRHGEALRHAEQALKSYTAAGERNGRGLALNSVGWLHAVLGDHRQALSYCGEAVELFRDLGSQEGVASALDSLGYAHQHLGDYAEATACYQQAVDLHRQVGGRWGVAETLGHLGDAHRAAGNPAQARTAWQEALAILDNLQHPDADQIRARLKGLSTEGSSG